MYPSGNDFKDINHKKYRAKEKRLMNLSLMKPKSKLVRNTFGCGSQLNQNINRFFKLTHPLNEICLLHNAFCPLLINKYGKHPVSTDGGMWYPQACKFLKLKHHVHSSFEKSIIKRTVQYIEDRTEGFDDYFPCKRKKNSFKL
jgi:hypothetical protein